MKKVFNYRNAALGLITVFSTVIISVAHATADPKPTVMELRYIGLFRDKPVFDLNFTNDGADQDYVLKIRDQFDNLVYKEVIKKGTLTRRFILKTGEGEDDALSISFEISTGKDNKPLVYKINSDTHVVEDVLINKVDRSNQN